MDRVIFSAEPITFLKEASPVSKPAEGVQEYSIWEQEIVNLIPKDLCLSKRRAVKPNDSPCCCYCSVAKSCLTLWHHGLQLARLPCPLLSPRVYSNSCPLSWWCSSSEQIKMLASYSDWVSRLQQIRLSPWGWGALTMEHTVGVWPNQPGFPGSSQ